MQTAQVCVTSTFPILMLKEVVLSILTSQDYFTVTTLEPLEFHKLQINTKTRTDLHGLSCVFFKLLYIFFNKDHLLLQECCLLFQDFYFPEDSGHVLESLMACFCRNTEQSARG